MTRGTHIAGVALALASFAEVAASVPVVKLSPRAVAEPVADAVPATMPAAPLLPSLHKNLVVPEADIEHLPRVRALAGGRAFGGAGTLAEVEGGPIEEGDSRAIYRPGRTLREPGTGRVLGRELIWIGSALGRRAETLILESNREVTVGDRLLPAAPAVPAGWTLSDAPASLNAPVLQLDGEEGRDTGPGRHGGARSVLLMGAGAREGLAPGAVVRISRGNPDNAAAAVHGRALVFRVFEHASYAFIIEASQPVREGDRVFGRVNAAQAGGGTANGR